jgi:hypothetical protein
MPQEVNHWIELTAVIMLAIYLFRPRRKPPSHPLPSGDARLLVRRLLAHKKGHVAEAPVNCRAFAPMKYPRVDGGTRSRC